MNAKIDLLPTQLVAELPSWWRMPAVIAATGTLLAASWAVARYRTARGVL